MWQGTPVLTGFLSKMYFSNFEKMNVLFLRMKWNKTEYNGIRRKSRSLKLTFPYRFSMTYDSFVINHVRFFTKYHLISQKFWEFWWKKVMKRALDKPFPRFLNHSSKIVRGGRRTTSVPPIQHPIWGNDSQVSVHLRSPSFLVPSRYYRPIVRNFRNESE